MNYVGKLFSNFKGFYNEINPATLTGAIDVVVIQQSDGTYTTSPWHVRFGKMGVIRARQNVVDIEINGKPAELHMKLGEAGEAFFVLEAEDTAELPAHLATSPISPVLAEMEKGLAALKVASANAPTVQDDVLTPVVEHCGTVVTVENGKMVVSGIPPASAVLDDDRQYFSDSDVAGSSLQRRRRQNASVATQTNMTSTDIDYIKHERAATPPGEWYAGLSGVDQETAECVGLAADQCRSLPNDSVIIDVGSAQAPQTLTHRIAKPHDLPCVPKNSLVKSSVEKEVAAEDCCLFELELSDEEVPVQLPPQLPTASLLTDTNVFSRCISLPVLPQTDEYMDDATDKWAAEQYAATSMHDYICMNSPEVSRPTSPLSDSEVMMSTNQDAMSQTQLTGDRLLMLTDIKWRWGEFPETSTSMSSALMYARHLSSAEQHATTLLPSCSNAVTQTGKYDERSKQNSADDKSRAAESDKTKPELDVADNSLTTETSIKEVPDVKDVLEPSISEPLPEQKKVISKKATVAASDKKDGIYLDDLNQDEPELAALYLYGHKSSPPVPRTSISKDEDSESGRGTSLPQSPVTVEVESHETSAFHSTAKPAVSSNSLNAAMSLCGPLDDYETRVSEDRFNRHLVTYEALCDNPAVVGDPNLVVRIGDKHYNWAIAGPLFMSQVVFNKPLTESCMSRLVLQHLPKKDYSRRGWRFWRRGETGTATASTSTKETSPSPHQASSPPDTPKKSKEKAQLAAGTDTVLSSDEESESLLVRSTAQQVDMTSDDETDTRLLMRDKCRKSLKLTSDQIAQLNLKEGVNEATFSVTTQYQGTTRCHCHIYLWRWDDRIVVSDIDGTITKSDVLGQVLPMIGSVLPYINSDWSQAGIAQLYQMIHRNGYKFVYLSARAIGQSRLTRDYLRSVKQSDINLPNGPLLLSPSSLMSAFHKEVIERKPEQFKISCLRDVSALFPLDLNPFCAGFGNKINDVWAYREVGIPLSRIFTVNHKGELRMEMTEAFLSSYSRLSDIVDHLFPPRHPGKATSPASEYSSFTYWRNPLPNLDAELAEFIKTRDADKTADSKKAATKKKKVPTATLR